VATAAAITCTSFPQKCSVQHAMIRARTRLWIRCGIVKTGAWSVRNAIVSETPSLKVMATRSNVKVITRALGSFLDRLKPGGVVVKHRGLWSLRREFESLPGYFCPGVNSYFFHSEIRGFLSASVHAEPM
jgi:hypothetical protein